MPISEVLNKIIQGDAESELRKLPDESIHCCVTSPPYYGLRDYNVEGQLGLEATPEQYVAGMVKVFDQIKRVLRKDGTLWLNIGDSYCASNTGTSNQDTSTLQGSKETQIEAGKRPDKSRLPGIKPKDLIGIPWMLAFALRNAGWYLRCDIIWAKRNCMPESVKDRPTRSHEYIFLLSKSEKYYYDRDAIKEPSIYDVDGTGTAARKARQSPENKSMPSAQRAGIRPSGFKDARKMNGKHQDKQRATSESIPSSHARNYDGFNDRWNEKVNRKDEVGMRNKRDVWTIAPAQFPEAHFATFPTKIPEICIKAGCPEGGVVIDPFMGAGTTALVARKLNRNFIGIELNPEYIEIANNRIKKELGMFR